MKITFAENEPGLPSSFSILSKKADGFPSAKVICAFFYCLLISKSKSPNLYFKFYI